MNEWLNLSDGEWWYVAGWTMLHFLWLGALVGLGAGVCRLLLRRASANLRYAAALASFVLLAALPIGIGTWIAAELPTLLADDTKPSVPPAKQATPIAPPAPGSAGGLTGAMSADGPAPIATTIPREPVIATQVTSNPRPTRQPGTPRGLTDLFAAIAQALPWAWILGTPLTFLLLTTGVVGGERLRRSSRVLDDGPIAEARARLVESLRIGRQVTVAVCERIATPVLVGIVRPIILLPPAALTGWSPDEIEMVLLHELAHVRRWDNLVNLIQRFVEAALFFHPAVWLVSSWVRSEREACCDAVVVGRTKEPHAYAEMLVALAAQMPRSVLFHPAASSAMAAGPLRGRIRRILGLQDDPMLVSGKSLGAAMGSLLVVATLLMLYLPEQTTAEEPKPVADEIAEERDNNSNKANDQAIRVAVMNQLKNLALAMHNYHDVKGSLPAVANFDASGKPLLSWRVHILPYLGEEEAALYKEFHLDEPWNSEHNQALISRMPSLFNIASNVKGITNYMAVVGDDCAFDGTARGVQFKAIADGLSNTVMLVEGDRFVVWTQPTDFEFDAAKPKQGLSVKRASGWVAVFADGSIQLIKADEPDDKLRDLFTCGRNADPLHLPVLGKWSTRRNPLSQAVADFNLRAQANEIGRFQPALTVEQVLSAIQLHLNVVPSASKVLEEIAVTQILPPGARLDFTTRSGTGADSRDVWWIDLSVMTAPNSGHTLRIRNDDFLVRDRVQKSAQSGTKFPSLENQKLADLAWKRLGVELEPIDQGELERVKALGYEGGLRVTPENPNSYHGRGAREMPFQFGDILVGLHVWPTSSLADVAAVLKRDDLDELNPLKFYVVRRVNSLGGMALPGEVADDTVASGRITVDMERTPTRKTSATESRALSPQEQEMVAVIREGQRDPLGLPVPTIPNAVEPVSRITATQPNTVRIEVDPREIAIDPNLQAPRLDLQLPPPALAVPPQVTTYVPGEVGPPKLRYDGKTFDEWRTIWQTELSLERRLEVVKALAAFGASGRGKEAAQAILDVANQLDWTSVDFSAPSGKLKQGCIDAFTTGQSTEGYRIPVKDWWPLVVPIYENSPEKSTIVTYLSYQLPAGEKELIPKLLELSEKDEATRNLAMSGLRAVDPGLTDERVMARLRGALQDPKAPQAELWWAMSHLLSSSGNSSGGGYTGGGGGMGPQLQLRMVPELQPLLFHPEQQVRQQARFTISNAQPKDAAALVEQLKQRIDVQGDGRDRKEAIRALAALGQRATSAEDSLKAIALNPKDSARISAAAALLAMWPDIANWDADDRLIKLMGLRTTDEDPDDLNRKLETEQQEIFGVYKSSLGGGGGMF